MSVLGAAPAGAQWLSYAIDPVAATPNLWFEYPSVLPPPGGYVAKRVKLEFGALTRQQPTGAYSIAPLLADALGMAFDDFSSSVVALELARTFWEKATILHAELPHEPTRKTRNRKPMDPDKRAFIAPWELRAGNPSAAPPQPRYGLWRSREGVQSRESRVENGWLSTLDHMTCRIRRAARRIRQVVDQGVLCR